MSEHVDQVSPEAMEEIREAMRHDAHLGDAVDGFTDAEVLAWADQGVPGSAAAFAQGVAQADQVQGDVDPESWAPFMQWAS